MKIIKLYVKSFILALAFACGGNILCIIDDIHVFSDGKKTICLIGEGHNGLFTPNYCGAITETRDKNYIIDLAGSASQSNEPVVVIIEASDCNITVLKKRLQSNPSIQAGTLLALALHAKNHNMTDGNALFSFADSRGPAYDALSNYMQPFGYHQFARTITPFLDHAAEQLKRHFLVGEEISPQTTDKALAQMPSLRRALFAPDSLFSNFFNNTTKGKLLSHDCTINELFDELEKGLNKLNTILTTKTERSPLYQYFRQMYDPLWCAVNDVNNFFVSIVGPDFTATKKSIADCIHDAILNHSFTYVCDEYRKWWVPLARIADIDFALAIDDALARANKVIFFGGMAHTNQLQHFIELMDSFKPVYSTQSGMCKINACNITSAWSDETVKTHFANAKKALSLVDSSSSEADRAALASRTLARSSECSVCHKSFANLFRCSRCKKVCYCSAECQKKDWANHKKICKASQ